VVPRLGFQSVRHALATVENGERLVPWQELRFERFKTEGGNRTHEHFPVGHPSRRRENMKGCGREKPSICVRRN